MFENMLNNDFIKFLTFFRNYRFGRFPCCSYRNFRFYVWHKCRCWCYCQTSTGKNKCWRGLWPPVWYYVFHWTLSSHDNSKRCFTEIIKNNVVQIGNTDGGNLATFRMNRNDKAWIKSTSSCNFNGHQSSFSGFKLI